MANLVEDLYHDCPVKFKQYIIDNPKFQKIITYDKMLIPEDFCLKTILIEGQNLYINTHCNVNTKVKWLIEILEILEINPDITIILQKNEN